jgi:hypothetical protein
MTNFLSKDVLPDDEVLSPDDISQQGGPKEYPILRALLGALSQELSVLRGSYQTRLIRDFSADDEFLYLESTYGFPAEGELYVDGHLVRYFSKAENYITEIKTSLVSAASGAVATLNDASSMGMIKVANDSMLVGRSKGAMLDVIGNNHAIPRYYDVDDLQYRDMIRTLAYMAGKGTDDSIEQFLDVILDHQSLCGDAVMSVTQDGRMALTTNQTNVAPFGSLLGTHNARLDVAYIAPNGELTVKRHRLDELSLPDPSDEFYYRALLREGKTPEFDPGSAWAETMNAAGPLEILWRVVPYRVWESPYKREEREARVGVHPFAQPVRQSVGNTVLVDILTPQPNSSVGVGYLAGQMVFESDLAGGLISDQRIVRVGTELRLYLRGQTTTHKAVDGLREYMTAYPRQVLSVKRVVKTPAPNRRSSIYLPVGSDLCATNAWIKDNDEFYVRLDHTVDAELNRFARLGIVPAPILNLRVDFGEVETPRPGDLHTPGRDLTAAGQVGVASGIATAQLLPSINTRNPSFLPPFVSITRASFPNVAGLTLEVELLTEFGTEYTQRLILPADSTFAQLAGDLRNIDARSPGYILDLTYAPGYQIIEDQIFGLRLISHANVTTDLIKLYMIGDTRASLSVQPIESPTVNNVSFGYTLPYVSPDPFTPRERIDYYPLYLGERNILLLSLIGDIITVAGVIPEVTSFSFQAYATFRKSWRKLLDDRLRRVR